MREYKTIGILGSGQLGQMLGLAAIPLGIRCIFYEASAGGVGAEAGAAEAGGTEAGAAGTETEAGGTDELPCASAVGRIYNDFNAFARAADVFTYEFENVPRELAQQLARKKKLFPSLQALHSSADRVHEKKLFSSLGISTVPWLALNTAADLTNAAEKLGFPFLIKSTRLGYDGKGQTPVHNERILKKMRQELFDSIVTTQRKNKNSSASNSSANNSSASNSSANNSSASNSSANNSSNKSQSSRQQAEPTAPHITNNYWEDLLSKGQQAESTAPYIAEQLVPLKRELSLISVRSIKGEVRHYPIAENLHRNGILYSSRAPARVSTKQTQQLHHWMEQLMKKLSYVGVLTLEVFDTSKGLLANEIAPRVHNSGHWSIEGAETSQFENHIRAISGMPLGDTSARGVSIMHNLVGRISPQARSITNCHLHLYGKSPRKGRKLGHITCNATSKSTLEKHAAIMTNHKNFY